MQWTPKTKDGRRIPALAPEYQQNGRHPRAVVMPLAVFPLLYLWWAIEPALSYFAMLRTVRNSERIARFLKLANDLRMRRKGVDHPLPLGTRRNGGTGKGGISG